jgi:23S rRNA (guanine745-N1)-methyltransferase
MFEQSMDPRVVRLPALQAANGAEAGSGQALRCPRGHSFDIARQGYVDLSAGTLHAGDTASMMAARKAFLESGHFDFISVALAKAAASATSGGNLMIDAGSGTGHHLRAVFDTAQATVGLALDVSKPALRQAARAHPRINAVRCDIWSALPVADSAAALVLNIFAPRNGAEFRRVLRRDGALLVVTPGQDHLTELVEHLELLQVDPVKRERVADTLAGHMTFDDRMTHVRKLVLQHADLQTLVQMGPSAWHLEASRLARRIAELPEPTTVTASVELAVYRPH